MASLMETEDKVHVVSMMGDAGFGSDGANEDNREEEALREMWQQCEDPEEKRQLRTRMYKLREDRIRDFYVGRDGQEILESILRTDNVSSRGCGEDDNANLQENRSVTSVASMVVTSSEIQSGHELTPVTVTKSAATVMKQVSKQGVTTTTTTSSKKTMKTNSSSSESDTKEETKQVKNRGTGKDRSPSLQLKEIKEQKNQHKPLLSNRRTVRRKSSAGENEIMAGNIGRIHPKQTSTVTYVLSNKVTNNQGKVVAGSNNIRNGVDAIGDRTNKGRRDSRVSKRGEQGNSTTTTITARNNHDNNAISSTTNASSSITTKTTIGGSTRVSGDGRKVNNSMIETTTITNMRSTKSSTMTTVKNVSSSTTIGRIGFSSTARKIDGAESFEKSSTGHKSRRQVMSSSLANESIPLGSVHIEELMETPGKDEVKVQRGATRAKKSSEKNVKESTTKYQRKSSSNADGEPINRNLSSSGGGGGGQQVTKSEMTKANATTTTTNTSSARTCSKGSATLNIHGSSSTTATGSSGDRSTGQDRGNKVVNKSRESSPKRSGSSYKGNSTRGTKATLKTGESLETPVIKVDREGEESSVGYGDGESVGSKSLKKDNNKTEESIIRELDILDNYLSQRSISIDEASAKESEKVDRTITTTTTMELGRSKPVGGENLAGKSDVMEVGIEPPFTRTEYKYNCPGEEDHHRHHKDHHHEDSSADRNTNELREPQSARNRDHDTKLNSSIEDQIIVDVVETSLTPSTRVPSNKGKSRSSSKPATLKANLSTNSATSKTNIKSSSAGIEPLMPAKKVDPTFLQIGSRQSSSTQMQIKQQKNETEILNRPSRKEQPKLTGTKNTSTFISLEEKVKSKPEPNPRALKKSFDGGDDDDETVEGSVVKMNSKVIRRDNVDDNNEDDNDDPLRPQTMKQGHDHPGAVLKAKSLFETKAQEAAMDRASADFDMDKGITQSAKVSKKAALFEARSRGERISVSSESSVATSSAPDEKGGTRVTQPVNQTELTTTSSTILSNTDNENANKLESPKKVSSTLMATSTSIAPTLKREKSILTAASKEIKDQDSSTATTVRSIKRKTSKETSTSRGSTTNTASAYTTRRKSSEVKFDTNENTAKTEQTRSSNKSAAKLYQQRRDSGKSETDEEQKTTNRHPRRKSTENGRESQKKELQSCVTTTSSTTCNRRRASQDKKVSPEPQPAAHLQKRDDESKRNENRRPSFPSHSTRKNSLQEAANCTIPTTTGSALLSRSDKLEQDENKRVESSGNTLTMTSTSVQINSNRMTTTELNAVMEIEDIEELTRLLEKATDYDERSKIRGRIRGLKRKAALVKRPSAENETTEGETLSKRAASAFTTNISSTSESVSIMNAKNKAMSSTTTTSTTTTNTTCGNGRKKSNERRRSSGEIPSNKVTTRKKSSELIGRENSSDDNNKNASDVVEVKKTLKANVVKSANDERKVRNRNKSSSPSPPPQSQLKPHAVTPQTIETTLIDSSVPTTTSTTMGGGGERRLSWETQQLLSTRKYSRDSPRQGEDEKKVSKVIDDVTPTPPNIKSGLTKEKVEPTPEEKTLGPAPTLEEKPTRPFTEEKTPKPLIKKPSRDKTSPPRVVSSLIESVAASTTMQKSREMTKAEKYEADILSRPSVFCQRRQEQQESQNTATKQEQVTTTTTTSFKSKALKTGETSLTSAQKSSSWNQEIKVTKEASPEPPTTKSTSRKKSADDSQDKVVKVTRKSSKDEIKEKSPPPPTRVPQRSSPAKYTRKGSSKEFKVVEKLSSNESAKLGEKIEMISKIPTTPAPTSSSPPASKKGGATTKDDQKSEDDKHKSDTEINFNQTQQSQSSSPPTTKHPKSQSEQPAPPPAATTSSLADRNKKTVKTDTPVKKNEKKSSAPLMDSSNSTSTTGSTITKFNLSTKSSSSGTTTNDTARDSHSKGTESVTSSYGVGPTDDDGTPLFGLKALRKIKQVQEQITTSTTSSAASTESTEKAGLSKEDAYTSTKQSLRASENFGLKALKKGSIASKGLLLAEDEDEEDTKKTQQQKKKNKIPESSVPEGSTRQTKSEFLSSTTTSTIRLQSSSSPPATTETETAEQRGANLDRGNSPKSILKKTSSFTSQIGTSGEGNGGGGGVVKSKTAEDDDDGNNFDEIESGTINSVKVGEDETTDEFRRLTTTSSTTSNITHSHSLGSDGGMEDSSWRRKSATPSPDPMNASSATNATTSGLLSLSRGKVGRSSVKEMSKRFLQTSESGETLSNCQTQQNLNEGDVVDHKPVFIRGSSPSRIPSPVKPSTTTTTITTTTKSSVEVSGGDPDGNIKIEVNRGDPDHEEVSYYSPSDSDGGGSGIIRITRTVTTTSGIGGGGGGRSFLNDSSPIQNLSDVIERMRGEEGQRKYTEDFSEDAEEGDCEKGKDSAESGLNLLNKFIGAQIIMKSVEPMLLSKKVTMSSSSLIVNGVNVDVETDPVRLRQLLAEVEGEDRERIGNRLRSLESGGTSVERSASTPSTQRSRPLTKTLSIGGVTLGSDSSDVADVTGELMPLIFGQLQSSLLDNIGASGSASGGGSAGNSHHNVSSDNSNNTCTNTNANALQSAADANTNNSSSSSSEGSSSTNSSAGGGGGPDSGEDCLFDSGTESGEDGGSPPSLPPVVDVLQPHHAKSESSPAEFSNFMEGLRNTLKRNQNKGSLLHSLSHFDALGALASTSAAAGGGATVSASDSAIAAKSRSQGEKIISASELGGGCGNLLDTSAISGNKGSFLDKKQVVSSTSTESEAAAADRTLVQQVDKVLSLLRDSLVKDPTVLRSLGFADVELNLESEKGKELIALIDRLKSTLSTANETTSSSGQEEGAIKTKSKDKINQAPTLPTVISTCEQKEKVVDEQPGINTTAASRAQEMLAWAQIRPPDTVPLPWVNHMQPPSERKSSTEGVAAPFSVDDGNHYTHKGRGGRRRSHTRSHTVGVTQEELAEARRYLQETALRTALEDSKRQEGQQTEKKAEEASEPSPPQDATTFRRTSLVTVNPMAKSSSRDSMQVFSPTGQEHNKPPFELPRQNSWHQDVEKGLSHMPRPFVKSAAGMFDASYVPPPERRMTCATLDDSVSSLFGSRDQTQNSLPGGGSGKVGEGRGSQFAKIKPFRTISLDNAYDPSKTFFTKEETVQIAVHQAAIKKQMSDEEDRRKRRNSLSSQQNIYGSGGGSGAAPTSNSTRDFSLALPTPYSSPQQQKQKQMKNSGRVVTGGNGSLNNNSFNAPCNSNDDHHHQNQTQSGGDSGFTEESGSDSRQLRNDQLVYEPSSQMSPISLSRPSTSSPRASFTTGSLSGLPNGSGGGNTQQQRIENVQISLKELSSSEFPQLQIAITLNTNAGNNTGPGGSNGGSSGTNNSITSNNNNSGNDPNSFIQSNFLSGRKLPTTTTSTTSNTLSGGGDGSGQMDALSFTSSSKANRYKSKKERKNRLKRANTIDIPQPPGFLLGHHDDDSEMDDEEEDSDVNDHDHCSVKSATLTYAPFKPKTEGDRKFLAFLEKNNSIAPDTHISTVRPVRTSHLGANDKFWNNRFFNLKSNFESSSQGSSPSPSPILSPSRQAPRSVSELALTHETITPSSASSDTFSKPIWATRDRGQLPQQVKNKLSVFESKNMEAASKSTPWRSSAPQIGQPPQTAHHVQAPTGRGSVHQLQQQPSSNAKRFVASSSVYSTNNVPTQTVRQQQMTPKSTFETQQNIKAPTVQRPVAVRGVVQQQTGPLTEPTAPQRSKQQQQVVHPSEGVHMVHATASALEAMKRSGFGPTAVVNPTSHHHHHPPQIMSPPPLKVLPQEKIELPWAKKEPLSPSDRRDPNAGRILMSKAKFEQLNHPDVMPMHPPLVHHGGRDGSNPPPPIPPKSANAKAFGVALSQNQNEHSNVPTSKSQRSSFPTSSVPNVTNLASNYGQSPPAVGPKPKFGTFGVTHSFDEALARKAVDNVQPIKPVGRLPVRQEPPPASRRPQPEYQQIPGSAFARKVSASEPQSRISSDHEDEAVTRKVSIDKGDIQTPVVARVMGAAQQQRAAIAGNRMSSLQNEEQASRLTNARSNIRNILNQFSQSQQSNDDSSDNNCSPPILKGNLQLSIPNPLAKSLSGNTLMSSGQHGDGGSSGYRPTSLVVGAEELSLHSSHSPSIKPYNSTNNNTSSVSPLSPNPLPTSTSVSPQPTTTTMKGTPIPSPVHHHHHHTTAPTTTRGSSEENTLQSQKQQHRALIPKQRSLSEFPKIATKPNMGILTIKTDLESLAKPKFNQHHPQQSTSSNKTSFKNNQQQSAVPSKALPVQKQSSFPQQQQLLQQMEEQASPKVLKSYPTSDSLQRTSSGSSIFNRAQSLFLSAQDGMPPSVKSRPKPPSLPKMHGMFPKQFEASMSPDSAKKKQKEVEDYFKQLTQQEHISPKKGRGNPNTNKSAHIRKSASQGKLLSRQRSLSDGEEDVDQIFESLFKASEERFSFNRSQFSRAQIWAQSSSKSLDMSNLMSGLGGGGSGSHAQYYTPVQSPPFCNQNYPFYDQQMQTFCETSNRRQFNFQQQQNGVPPLPTMRPQLPPLLPTTTFPSVAPVVTTPPISGGISGTSSLAANSQIQQKSQIMQQSSSSSTSSFKSTTSSTTSSVGGGAGLNKFKQMDQQAKANSGGAAPMFKLSQGLKTSANSAKDILLYWCQCRTRDYENVKIENFSSSWSDGLAFCALIHHFYPDAFDYKSLDPKNRRFNFDLAFRVADEKAGIYPLLDTEDMIVMGRRPDWKCVFTYVQSMYRSLKDLA